jgi:hypothetical protein
MRFPAVPQIDIAEEGAASPSISGPQIVWPTMLRGECGYEEGDAKRFPDDHEYHERRKLGIGGAMSAEFHSAVRRARDRIWVLDDYVLSDDKSAKRLIDVLVNTAAIDIKLATSEKARAKQWALYLKALEPTDFRNPATRIKVSLNLRKIMFDVHDRFAVIDDVLWHCGATIGGLHHAINAMTFGWSVRATRADEFFDRLWSADSEEAGQAFRQEAGHRFRVEAGRDSDLMSATWHLLPRIDVMMFCPERLVKRAWIWHSAKARVAVSNGGRSTLSIAP